VGTPASTLPPLAVPVKDWPIWELLARPPPDLWRAPAEVAAVFVTRSCKGPPNSICKNLGCRQQKGNALSESFRRSFPVSGRLVGEPLIAIGQETVVDRKQLSVSALVAWCCTEILVAK
jgi:hypothetical protein